VPLSSHDGSRDDQTLPLHANGFGVTLDLLACKHIAQENGWEH
jgi:hypothetical protein